MFSASTSRVGDAYMRRRSCIYSSPPRPIPLPPSTGLPQTPPRGDTAVSSGLIHTHTHTHRRKYLNLDLKVTKRKLRSQSRMESETHLQSVKKSRMHRLSTRLHTHTHTHSFTNSTTPLRLHITGRPARDSRRRPA